MREDKGSQAGEKILAQARSGDLMAEHQAFDNITCFTHPTRLGGRLTALEERLPVLFRSASGREKESLLKVFSWVALAFRGSREVHLNLVNRKRHGGSALSEREVESRGERLLGKLQELEKIDAGCMRRVLEKEKKRLERMRAGKGRGLLAARAAGAPTDSLRRWVAYWSVFGRESHLRQFRDTGEGLVGVDYGLGVLASRILWGADLVMMNAGRARMALGEDEELEGRRKAFREAERGKLPPERMVREAMKIAGLKARYAMRAPFLLRGRGKVSFQLNPLGYDDPELLVKDIRRLHGELNQECLRYDSGLFLQQTMTEDEIRARRGRSHVFYNVNGSSRNVYGHIEDIMREQVRRRRIDLVEGDSGGVMEKVMGEGINCNATVAGFVNDGLWAFFCQLRGHARARAAGLPTSHSLITKMGGGVEAALRWLALGRLVHALERKALPGAEEVRKVRHTQNGALDDPSLRQLVRKSGLVLAEETPVSKYESNQGRIFPEDRAICTIAEAISKRSHRIMAALKDSSVLRKQGVLPGETGDLQAWVCPPYGGRYHHVEELVGIYAQAHFPDTALAIEEWKTFRADPKAIERAPDSQMVKQLYNSVIGAEWAAAYEVDGKMKEVLGFFGVYEKQYGERGIRIDDLAAHPFSQQTLFGKVVGDAIPQSEEDKDRIKAGLLGDFNALREEMIR